METENLGMRMFGIGRAIQAFDGPDFDGPDSDMEPYKAMVRPHMEFANSIWCPYKLGDNKEIEKVQKRATKLIIKLKNKPYRDRLFHLNLPTGTLKYRRLQADMVEVFKITHNIYLLVLVR